MSEMLQAAGLQTAGDIGAAIIGSAANKKEGKRAWRRTKVLNQNQVQWRVRDAQAAGISPLVAMGMSPIGPYPESSGSLMGDAFESAGRNLANYKRSKAASAAERAAAGLAADESKARTQAALSEARRNQAEADYLYTQAMKSTAALFSSPGRPRTDMETLGVSPMHERLVSDADPRAKIQPQSSAMPGKAIEITTPWGPFKMNPNLTPIEMVEALRGDFAGSMLGLAFSAHDALNQGDRPSTSSIPQDQLAPLMKLLPLEWIAKLAAWRRQFNED